MTLFYLLSFFSETSDDYLTSLSKLTKSFIREFEFFIFSHSFRDFNDSMRIHLIVQLTTLTNKSTFVDFTTRLTSCNK
jgi:hypothetical protein